MNTPYETNDLAGQRYLNWVRCSTVGQAGTSIPDQLQPMNAFGGRCKMTHVGDIVLAGVSGLSPKILAKVKELVHRKQTLNDFDVILVYDLTRLTRSGVAQGARIFAELADVGVKIICIKDEVPEGEIGEVYKSFLHYAANQQSRAIALSTTRGSMSSLKDGRRAHAPTANYGLDKRVIGLDGKPRFRLRVMEDGSQQKLSLNGKEVLEIFAPNPRKGAANHYRLQKNETFDFVPGDPRRVEVVNQIYRRHHLDGWGCHSIAREINDMGVPAPRGGRWHAETAQNILRNPIYLGVGIANQETTGRYYMRSKDGATLTHRSPAELAQYNQLPRKIRPQSDWEQIEQPELREFLDPRVRQPAATEQADYFKRRAERSKKISKPAKRRDRHLNSPFILKQRLRESTTGRPMVGHTTKRGDKRWLSYKTSGAFRKPCKNPDVPTKMIRAHDVNQLVVGMLGKVVRAAPDLKAILRRQIMAQQAGLDDRQDRLAELNQQHEQIQRKLGWLVENICSLGEEAAGKKLAELQPQRERIETQIKALSDEPVLSEAEVETLVDRLIEQLGKTNGLVKQVGMPAVERLLDVLLVRAVADVETKIVDFEFRLPEWALTAPEALCLESGPDYETWREAGARQEVVETGLLLMKFKAFPLADGRWLVYGRAA